MIPGSTGLRRSKEVRIFWSLSPLPPSLSLPNTPPISDVFSLVWECVLVCFGRSASSQRKWSRSCTRRSPSLSNRRWWTHSTICGEENNLSFSLLFPPSPSSFSFSLLFPPSPSPFSFPPLLLPSPSPFSFPLLRSISHYSWFAPLSSLPPLPAGRQWWLRNLHGLSRTSSFSLTSAFFSHCFSGSVCIIIA